MAEPRNRMHSLRVTISAMFRTRIWYCCCLSRAAGSGGFALGRMLASVEDMVAPLCRREALIEQNSLIREGSVERRRRLPTGRERWNAPIVRRAPSFYVKTRSESMRRLWLETKGES